MARAVYNITIDNSQAARADLAVIALTYGPNILPTSINGVGFLMRLQLTTE